MTIIVIWFALGAAVSWCAYILYGFIVDYRERSAVYGYADGLVETVVLCLPGVLALFWVGQIVRKVSVKRIKGLIGMLCVLGALNLARLLHALLETLYNERATFLIALFVASIFFCFVYVRASKLLIKYEGLDARTLFIGKGVIAIYCFQLWLLLSVIQMDLSNEIDESLKDWHGLWLSVLGLIPLLVALCVFLIGWGIVEARSRALQSRSQKS